MPLRYLRPRRVAKAPQRGHLVDPDPKVWVDGRVHVGLARIDSVVGDDPVHEIDDGRADGVLQRPRGGHGDQDVGALDSDEGARYIGEFSLGFNPMVLTAMKDILFDEKIAGSLHFTPGNSYDEANNGNKSGVHWDMVLMQDPASGGGEIWFDGKLIRKDGVFVVPELAGLNPDNLKG